VPKTINGCNYTNGYDNTMIKLYKWMWQTYTNGGNKTIKMDGKILYKWMWPNYTNGFDKTIRMDGRTLQMDVTRL